MKSKIYLLFILTFFVSVTAFSQKQKALQADTGFFNYKYWNGVADKKHMTAAERAEMIAGQKSIYLEQLTHKHVKDEDLVWVTHEPVGAKGKKYNGAYTNAGPCTNIDFEQGTFAGWTRSTGFNPLTNVAGCCGTANGDQTIISTTGNDPYGGFPMVYPGGGSSSARLGSTATGGRADRISQTFFVTAATANFTYRYAAVLNDGGHSVADQPRFTSEIIDTLGNPITCTFYQVSAGSGVTGYSTSALGAPGNNSPVIYKPWTNVTVDLTPNIGQNVTLQFTVYDCGPSGHFAYAYLDGICTSYETAVQDTACPNTPVAMCAPAGFLTTNWNGPGVVNDPNQCIIATIPGVYTCTTLLVPGCPGPTFSHTLTNLPAPVLSFTAGNASACAPTYSFISTKTISSGFIQSFYWDFGDGTPVSTAPNPVHVYANSGTYAVKLRAVSNRGCADSTISFVTIYPNPNLSFVPFTNCINSLVQFTNTSNIPVGSIVGYTWSLGTGNTSVQTTYTDNPTETYTTIGIYTLTLVGQSNQGCISTLTQTMGIFPPPIIDFTANPLCDKNGTAFTPSISTSVAAGSLAGFSWNFGDGQTSAQPSPVHTYTAPGIYTVSLLAMSNHNCYAAISHSLQISPSPTVAFTTTSVNACTQNFTFTNNSSISSGFVTYTWSFGGTNTTTATNPTYFFPSIGNYTVKLIGVSNLGCGDTVTQKIQVFPLPTLTVSVPASCESAVFTASANPSSGTITSYAWDFGEPSSGAANTSTLQNPIHLYAQTNTFVLTLSIVSNANCPSTQTVLITIYPNPVASFTYATLNNCSLPFTYTNNSSVASIGASSIASSYWDFGFPAGISTFSNPGTINFPSYGTYTVTHITTTNRNCKDTATHVIQVHPLPQLSFSLNSGCVNLPVTINTSATISPVPLPTASVGSLFWNYADGNFAILPSSTTLSSHTWTVPGNYNVTFTATSDMGCTSVAQKTIDIYPSAVGNFTTSGTTCLNSGVQFTSNPTIAPPGVIYAMNWDFGDGTFGSNAITSHTYAAIGNYVVTYSLITNNECLTTITKSVSVDPVPTLTSAVNGGCLNTPSQFTSNATVPAPGSIASYTTFFASTASLVSQNPVFTYTTAGTKNPTVMATSDKGCIATVINTLVIDPLPELSFSPHDACQGAPVQFSVTQNILTGSITTYTWNFGNGTTSNQMLPAANYSTYGVYTVTLGATSLLGCSSSTVGGLTIHPYPGVTVTPTHNSCVNDSIRINTNIDIFADAVQSYSLNFGDGQTTTYTNVSSTYSVNHKYTAYNTYTIILTAISTFGCKKDTSAPIIVYPKPFVNWTASKFCYGDSTKFSNSSTIPTGYTIDSHLWNFNDNSATPTSTLSNPTHFFQTNNSYSVYAVSLTELSYPEGTLLAVPLTCSLIVAKTITVFPVPVANFASNAVCLGSPTQFTNLTPTLNTAGYSWYQYNNGVLGSLAPNPSFTYSNSGTYTAALIVLNTFGCRDTFQDVVKIYQNPVAFYTTSNNCLGLPSVFTNSTSFPEGSPAGFSWAIDNTTLTTTDAAYPFLSAGTYTVGLTSTSDLGCSSTFNSTITVYPLPSVSFTNSQTCIGQNTQFNNLTQGNIVTYAWNFGDPSSGSANTSGLITPSHQYASPGTYATTLIAVTDKNCSSNFASNVIVHNKPTANFTHTTICATEKLSFTDLSTTQDGALTRFDWDFNGDNIPDQTTLTPSYVYSAPGNYQIHLTVTSEFGCSDDTLRQVTVNPKVIAGVSSDFKSGCPTLCVNFKDASSIATGSWTTAWDFSDGSPTTTFSAATRCFPASGNYDVDLTLVSNAGCRTRQLFPGYINVYPLPKAGFKVEPEQVDEDEPIITISNGASADANSIRYYVSDGSNFSTPDFTHLIKNLRQTKPMVVQIAKNQFGCIDTIMQVLDIKPSYTVYFPNVFTPNGDGVNDDFRPKGVGIIKFTLQIYDRWGHQVFKTNDITDVWNGQSKDDESIKEDTYTWKAQVTDVFNKNHFMVGHVTVIR
ncbi:hypothetical protein CNR22_20170 [Sphingobacteriaceae bacterium]|nr:hypothetical protein CNR22_20170 [Sphingobacteriaceae bacterium]